MKTPTWGRKLFSSDAEKKIETAIQQLESEVGAELRIAILKASDPYPAASWRICVLTFFVLFLSIYEIYYFYFKYEWQIALTAFLSFICAYGVGKIPFLKKFFLLSSEVDREVREKALELFFTLQIHETSHRCGSLLVLSLLEHRMEFLIDKNLKPHLTENELAEMLGGLRERFQKHQFDQGILKCIEFIQEKFKNELPDFKNQPHAREIHNSIVWGGL